MKEIYTVHNSIRSGIIARKKSRSVKRREKTELNGISTDKIKNRNASNFMCAFIRFLVSFYSDTAIKFQCVQFILKKKNQIMQRVKKFSCLCNFCALLAQNSYLVIIIINGHGTNKIYGLKYGQHTTKRKRNTHTKQAAAAAKKLCSLVSANYHRDNECNFRMLDNGKVCAVYFFSRWFVRSSCGEIYPHSVACNGYNTTYIKIHTLRWPKQI